MQKKFAIADCCLLSAMGSRPYHSKLRRLYCALLLPKLDYGCFLYGTASATNLTILDRIQYAAPRTIVGALGCTPTIKLEAEADVMPLAMRRSKLLLQYRSRVLGVGNHTVRQLILEYFSIQDVLDQTYVLPAIGRLHDEFRVISLNPVDYPAINMSQRYSTKEVPTYCSRPCSYTALHLH